MQLPPRKLILSEVPEYLKTTHGVEVSRITVYAWTKTGRRGHFLRTDEQVQRGGRLDTLKFTYSTWVDAFVQATGLALK
jgi:hypothetical protein